MSIEKPDNEILTQEEIESALKAGLSESEIGSLSPIPEIEIPTFVTREGKGRAQRRKGIRDALKSIGARAHSSAEVPPSVREERELSVYTSTPLCSIHSLVEFNILFGIHFLSPFIQLQNLGLSPLK